MYIENKFRSERIAQRVGIYDNFHALGIDFLSISCESKSLDFRGSLEVEWGGCKLPYEIPCNLGITMEVHSKKVMVRLIYSPQVNNIPDFLSEFIPSSFSRQLYYNLRGAILREIYPCLGLGSSRCTEIKYKGCSLDDGAQDSETSLDQVNRRIDPLVEEGFFGSPLQFVESIALRKISFEGGFDEMACKVLGAVSVQVSVIEKHRSANQLNERLFISDTFFVNLSEGEMYSVETSFPVGPWWLLGIRAKFDLH